MVRFVSWLIGLLLMLVTLLTIVLSMAGQDQTPGLLQRIGYGTCDGLPCFRGVTLGMGWTEARSTLKEMTKPTIPTELNVTIGEGGLAMVRVTANSSEVVNSILTTPEAFHTSLDARLGEVLLMYGTPCRIGRMIDISSQEDQFVLVYPSMAVLVKSAIIQVQTPAPIVTIHPNSPIKDLWIISDGFVGDCVTAPFALWRGFASSQTYLREQQPVQPPN